MLPPCHLFQKVCGRRWILSGWLSSAREIRVAPPPFIPLGRLLLLAVRLHAAARHAWGDLGRESMSPAEITKSTDHDVELFPESRNRTVTNLKCGTTQCKNPVKCDKSLSNNPLSPVTPVVAASVTGVVCSGMLRIPSTPGRLHPRAARSGELRSLCWALNASATAPNRARSRTRDPAHWCLGILGALIGGLAGFGFGKGGQQKGSGLTVVGAAAGGLAGFFIGRQLDERRAISFRGTPSLQDSERGDRAPGGAERAGDPR